MVVQELIDFLKTQDPLKPVTVCTELTVGKRIIQVEHNLVDHATNKQRIILIGSGFDNQKPTPDSGGEK